MLTIAEKLTGGYSVLRHRYFLNKATEINGALFPTTPPCELGVRCYNNPMTILDKETKDLCASWWADRLKIPEKRDDFKAALLLVLSGMDSRQLDEGLWVDYDPQGLLLVAVRKAGIECDGILFSARGILPEKTGMIFYDGIIETQEGYGARFNVLKNLTE